ncbi:hypothetical protein VNO80_07766 [Phaseolus coccineus]|uniref:Pentatricopeptide repeat-containing protein n=1 Tax=Phaseolus coccineus TaxID=3886 RepID=A0AAN9NK95_PHACN
MGFSMVLYWRIFVFGCQETFSFYIKIVLNHGLFLNGKLEEAYRYYAEMQEKGFLPGPKIEEMLQAWVSGEQGKEDQETDLEPNQLENNSLKNIVKDIPSKFDMEKNFLHQPKTKRVDGMRVHSQTSISLS